MFDWVTGLLEGGGYAGIALLMLLENAFPPIPSELIMPLAGFLAARGELSLPGVILAGTAGSLAGALFWYAVGRRVGGERLGRWADRHGRWLTLSSREVEAVDAWFDRHGGKAVLLGRLVPGVRTLVSVPAGLSGMAPIRFLLFSALGTAAWTALLAGAGYLLEAGYDAVAAYLDPVANGVLGLLGLGYLYRVATFRPRGGRRRECRSRDG